MLLSEGNGNQQYLLNMFIVCKQVAAVIYITLSARLRICSLYPLQRSKILKKKRGDLAMTLNCFSSGECGQLLIAITPRSTLTWITDTC